jgi:chromosome segregation ATPase
MRIKFNKCGNCYSSKYLTDGSEDEVISLKSGIKKLQIEVRDSRQQITSLERDLDETEKDIARLESEKARAQARSRALENELRITKAQVDELLSTNLDNENVIRMKVYRQSIDLITGFTNRCTSREHSTTCC